jgi:hypothetical protein
MACQLTAGERELAGGRIFQTEHWVVEHCIGTLGVGALILKRSDTNLQCAARDTPRKAGP